MEALAVVVDDVVEPARPHHGQRLVEPACPFASLDPERLVLAGVGDAEAERRQQAPAGHHGQRRQLLGQHDRVAAGQHQHAHPELEARRAPGGVRHRHDRVGRVAADALGQPQAVEAEPLERVDDVAELGSVQPGPCPEPDADAHLHGATGCQERRVDV